MGRPRQLHGRRSYNIGAAKTYSFYIEESLMEHIDALAASQSKSRSEIVDGFLRQGVNQQKVPAKIQRAK